MLQWRTRIDEVGAESLVCSCIYDGIIELARANSADVEIADNHEVV